MQSERHPLMKRLGTFLAAQFLDADRIRRRLPPFVQLTITRAFYDMLSYWFDKTDITFLDCGWAPLDGDYIEPNLDIADERDRNNIRLYHRVAQAVDLRGADVLEVGCGRGGGASYIKRYLGPKSVTAIDISGRAIAFCKKHHVVPDLHFIRANAEDLPFEAQSFDVVINIESSGSYPSFERFVAGVYRVLRPGGYFLFADMREKRRVNALERSLSEAGFTVIEKEDMSQNVVRAIEAEEERKVKEIERVIPRFLRPVFDEFAATRDTDFNTRRLRTGERVFLRFVLRKPTGVTR